MTATEDEVMLAMVDEALAPTPGIEEQFILDGPEPGAEFVETEEDRVVLNPEAEPKAEPEAKPGKKSKKAKTKAEKTEKKAEKAEKAEKKTEKKAKGEPRPKKAKEPKPPKIRRPYKSVELPLLTKRFKKTHSRFLVCKERFDRMQHKINMYENEFRQRDIAIPV